VDRRRTGWALLLYGIGGVAILGWTAFGAGAALERLDAMSDPRSGVVAEAARSLEATASGFDGLQTSLADARRSTDQAAAAARQTADGAAQLASGMSLQVFGIQPFASLAGTFRTEADQLRQLAGDLDAVSHDIDHNSADVSSIRASLVTLRQRLLVAGGASSAAETAPLRILGLLLLLWLAIPAVAAIAVGLRLVRTPAAATAERSLGRE
jgi:hypothetical protein